MGQSEEENDTPWQRAMRSRSERQEHRLGQKHGGRRQINSGRLWSSKGDVRQDLKTFLGRLLIEAKTTDGASYRLDRKDWEKISQEANQTPPGCLPMMNIEIQELKFMWMEEALWDQVVAYIIHLETRLEQCLKPRD